MTQTAKVIIGILAFLLIGWLFVKLSELIAKLIDSKFQSTPTKTIINRIRRLTLLLLVICLLILSMVGVFKGFDSDIERGITKFAILFLFLIIAIYFWVMESFKEIRKDKDGILFPAEVDEKLSKKTARKIITIVVSLIFIVLMGHNILYLKGDQLFFLAILYGVCLLIGYALIWSKSGYFSASDAEYKYNNYIFQTKEEMFRHKREIERDKPRITIAIKNKDLEFLYLLAQKYQRKDYFIEVSQIIDEIEKIDKNDLYAKKTKELFEAKDEEIFKDDSDKYIGDEATNNIKKLEKICFESLSPQNILAIAEAYRNYRMTKEALMYYENVIKNFKRSKEAKIAQKAIEELKVGKTGFTNIS